MKSELKYKYEIGYIYNVGESRFKITDKRIVFDSAKGQKKKKQYYVECLQCGYKAWKDEKYIYQSINGTKKLSGKGCWHCNQRHKATKINCIANTDEWMIPLLKDPDDAYKYSSRSGQKILFKCPYCGEEKYLAIHQVYRYGRICCNKCGDGISYPNRFGYCLLKQLDVEKFETEFSDEWTLGHRYDFMFIKNNIKYLLEMDGTLHYEDAFNNTTLKGNNIADKIKDELAKDNGYKLIRINCYKSEYDYIKKNIFSSDLANIFDLSVVDWDKLKKECVSNRIFDVCNYYTNNPGISVCKIAEEFGLSANTIYKYLRTGTDCGFIEYKSIIEKSFDNYIKTIEYRNLGLSIREICEKIGAKDYNVRSYIKKGIISGAINDVRTDTQRKHDKIIELIKDNLDKSKEELCRITNCCSDTVSNYLKEVSAYG